MMMMMMMREERESLGSQCNVILKHKCSQCHAWPMIRKYPLGYSWASRTATDIHVHTYIHTYIDSYLWSEFLFLSSSSKNGGSSFIKAELGAGIVSPPTVLFIQDLVKHPMRQVSHGDLMFHLLISFIHPLFSFI